jgi:hypothetical protein
MEVWPSARTFGVGNLHFQTPHSLINQSIIVHFDCKLGYYYVLSALCLSSTYSSLSHMYAIETMCCILRRNEFFPDRENCQ